MRSALAEVTSSSNIEDDCYTFKEEPCSPSSSSEHQFGAEGASAAAAKAAAPCKVCGDKASGYHYGVTSCEGCKGFFRRSIQKQIEYRCLRDGKCVVIRLNRNRCQFCRFKKCITVGMSRDSVRYGRVPKRTREMMEMPELARNLGVPGVVPAEDEPDVVRQGVSKELTRLISAAHRANNTYTEELNRTLQYQTIILKIEDSDTEGSGGEEAATSTTDRVTDARCHLWYSVALRITPTVQQVVEFAKRLPGFHTLPQDDQLILIKLGFYEVWLTRASRLSTYDCIVFDDGTAISKQQLEIVYDPKYAEAMLAYTHAVSRLRMSEDEMALFTASLLLFPQRAGLSDPERIATLHRAVLDAIQHDFLDNGMPNASARLEAFSSCAVEVRAIGVRHNELLGWCREHWPRLALPALFSEIFDIPKSEDDVVDALRGLQG